MVKAIKKKKINYKTCTEILKTISFILFPGTYKNSFLVTFPFFMVSSLLNTLGFLKNIISRILNIHIYLHYFQELKYLQISTFLPGT